MFQDAGAVSKFLLKEVDDVIGLLVTFETVMFHHARSDCDLPMNPGSPLEIFGRFDWIGRDWIRMDFKAEIKTGVEWIGSEYKPTSIGLDKIGMDWNGLDWNGIQSQRQDPWPGLTMIDPEWTRRNWNGGIWINK